ncbi:MAG TPA: SAM-dependent methyltransferase [Bacteroidales bacterium]|nr:SAM-dependent methyltransferase [Bacteroidales bacterium]
MIDVNHSVKLAQDFMVYKMSSKSSAGHGIHSPLVYSFARDVVRKKERDRYIDEIEWYRDWQIQSPLLIKKSHHGAGSKLAYNEMPIGRLIRSSSVSSKHGVFLYRLAKWLDAKQILELGTSVGISTMYLSGAQPHAKIVSLEGDRERALLAKHSFDFMECNNIEVIEGDFDITLSSGLSRLPVLDMVFFDGNHSAEPTLRYFKQCLEHIHNNTAFVFDDIRWSNEMFRTWQVIANHSSVSVSIDLFSLGVVLFRKDIPKQHFVINF